MPSPDPTTRGVRARALRTQLAVLVAITLGVSMLTASGSPGAVAAGPRKSPSPKPTCIVCAPILGTGGKPSPSPSSAKPKATAPKPAAGHTLRAAATRDHVVIYTKPGGKRIRDEYNPNGAGSPLNFLVASTRADGWYQVYLPTRPNGSTGWVRASQVKLVQNPWRIEVDRGSKRLRVFHKNRVVRNYPVAVGRSGSPTPAGLTYLEAQNKTNPRGSYGPWALGLSFHSTTYSEYGGGDGRIAIHGTRDRSSIGKNASAGCIRMYNEHITALVELKMPLGTPVRIR